MRGVAFAFIGSAGLPNKYGGFEAFLEHCAPAMAERVRVLVTCDAHLYPDREPLYQGVERIFLGVRANGAQSVLHDLIAFFRVYPRASHIIVLGVSGGPWFPLFRLFCAIGGRKLAVNVDGVEWQRGKFSAFRKAALRLFDTLAQSFAHRVIIDNEALRGVLIPFARKSAACIAYPGDHVLRMPADKRAQGARTGLTVCRIEPENNIEMVIQGALRSGLAQHRIIGNWDNSDYGRSLREKYAGEPRIAMLDPVYDQTLLGRYREECDIYIHGHSVGGTNPSLVEILFYDCAIFCFDVEYHHQTAGACAQYFADADHLARAIDQARPVDLALRERYRRRYLRTHIIDEYFAALGLGGDRD